MAPRVREEAPRRRIGVRCFRDNDRPFRRAREGHVQETHPLGIGLDLRLLRRLVGHADVKVHVFVVVEERCRKRSFAQGHRHDHDWELQSLRDVDRHDLERVALAFQLPRVRFGIHLTSARLVDPLRDPVHERFRRRTDLPHGGTGQVDDLHQVRKEAFAVR